MKNIAVILLAALALTGCVNRNKSGNKESVSTDNISVQKTVADTHNSQNSLDYTGEYKGTLLVGATILDVTLTLADSTYEQTVKYPGNTVKSEESKGIYTWDESGRIITLGGADIPNEYFVGENTLFQLDSERNRIQGEHVLKKQN